jgi:phosphate transport system permease protein
MGRRFEEACFKVIMVIALLIVAASLVGILAVVLIKGLPALNLAMITQVPTGGSYEGKGGGILNAITGSLCLALGATLGAFLLSLPMAFYFQKEFSGRSKLVALARLSLDVLWGIPSIVYGAFVFIIMLYLGLRASLLAGIIALTLVEFPIMTRAMDEIIRMVPLELKESAYSLGSTRLETTLRVVWRQILPGIVTAILLAFGRGIGDAAAVLFTAGYTDYLPSSLMEPAASLPLAVFFQLLTPFPEVQQRAYASGAVLLAIVLLVSLISRLISRGFEKHVVR